MDYLPNLLLEACFVPSLTGIYPDRPQSPVPERLHSNNDKNGATTTATSTAAAPTVAASATAGRYVPPSARHRAGGSGLAERLRQEREQKLQGATTVVIRPPAAVSVITGRVIPGMAPVTSGKSKSQVKRDKTKKKKEQQQQQQDDEEAEIQEQQQQQSLASTAPGVSSTPETVVDREKRARKIKKQLKQIEELKQQKSCNDWNEDQKAKVASEVELRAELEQLGLE